MIERIIGLDVFTKDGEKYDARDFINTPRVGDTLVFKDDRLYSEHQGDSSECESGLCDLQMDDVK